MTGQIWSAGRFNRAVALLLVFGSIVIPCYAEKVKSVVNPKAEFSKYQTYQWLPVRTLGKAGMVEEDPAMAPVIRAAMDRELTARGLKEVKEGGDLQISAIALAASVPQLEAVIFPGNLHMDYATPIATMGRYNREGTLAVNVIDTKTKDYVWAAVVTKNVNRDPGSGIGKIPKAVEEMFRKYPIKKK
jgi:hypothetical protein